jgi:hypothetical protein
VQQDSQLFRFEGTYKDGLKVVGKVGGELQYNADSNRFYMVEQDSGTIFWIEQSPNFTYGIDKWGIRHDENSHGLFAHDIEKELVYSYQLSFDGSVFEFIYVSRPLTVTVTNPAKGSVNKGTGLYVDNSEVTVVATPTPYNRLNSWTIDGVAAPATSDTLVLKLDRNITLEATFVGNDTRLGELGVEAGGKGRILMPVFDPNTSDYTVRVPAETQSVTISAAPLSAESTVAGDVGEKALTSNDEAFQLTVTAEDASVKAYSINVLQAAPDAGNDVSLWLSLNGGAETPVEGDTITLNVANSDTIVGITAKVATGAILVGDTGRLSLASAGDNTAFSVTVLAANYDDSKTYTVIVHRLDNNALLSDLALTANGGNGSNLLASFAPDITSYAVSVTGSVTGVTITPVAASSYATVTGSGSQSLIGPADTFRIVVSAEDGSATYTYTVIVHSVSSDATLQSLAVAGQDGAAITLSPAFDASVESYTASTPSATVTVSATANSSAATVAYAPSQPLTLTAGENRIQVTVTAEDGSSKVYQVTVTLQDQDVPSAVGAVALGSLTLYPNPVTNGDLKVENGTLKAGERIEIYSLLGTLVAAYEVAAGAETAINVSQLPQGVYIVKAGAYAAKLFVY